MICERVGDDVQSKYFWILILRKAFVGEVVGRMHLIVVQIVRSLSKLTKRLLWETLSAR